MRIISGTRKGRPLQRPPQQVTRPTTDRVRESVFNILLHLEGFSFDGAVVLDLFAGSGAMGLEALSRGATQATFVELNPIARQVVAQNVQALKFVDQSRILGIDALDLPSPFTAAADLIFIDPPYFQNLEIPVINHLLVKGWIKLGTIVVLEASKKTKLDLMEAPFSLLTARTFGNTAISIFKASQGTAYP